jgi:hypothetical protein
MKRRYVGRNNGYFYYVMELADPAGNPKPECQNPKETRNPNVEGQNASEAIRASGFLRHSTFVIRICTCLARSSTI